MRDLRCQVQRGIFNGGFVSAILLVLYSWWFVNSNVGIIWSNPLAVYAAGDFHYHVRTSLDLGFFHTAIPLAAMLPLGYWLCEDISTRFMDLSLSRRTVGAYVGKRLLAAALCGALAVLAASALYLLFLLLVSGPRELESFNPLALGQTVHGWRDMQDFFYVFVLESLGRLMLSAIIWALVATGFSALWPNKAFVFVAVFAASVLVDVYAARLFGPENTLSNLQNQQHYLPVPLDTALFRQLLYLLAALAFASLALYFRFAAPLRRIRQRARNWLFGRFSAMNSWQPALLPHRLSATSLGRLFVDLRANCSPHTLLPAAMVPLILLFSGPALPLRFSVGDLWLRVFSGVPWVEATWADVRATTLWAVLLSPVLLGNALNTSRELGGRSLITLPRYPSISSWWRSKSLSNILYTVLCVSLMFFSVLVAGYLMGTQGIPIHWPDADGFTVPNVTVLWALFAVFLLQAILLTLLQTAVHLASNSLQLGALSFLLPLIACLLLYANYDRPVNTLIPYNWGMLIRSTLFSPAFEPGPAGEPLPLAAVPLKLALWGQTVVCAGLMLVHELLIRVVPVTERELNR